MALFARLPNLLRIRRPHLSSLLQHAAPPCPCLARVSFRPGLSTTNTARLAAARIGTTAAKNLDLSPFMPRVIDLGLECWKSLKKRFNTGKHIKVLPSKPSHAYQPRGHYVKELHDNYVKLLGESSESSRHSRSKNMVVAVYIKGEPASGKTQVAREFGEKYYKEKTTTFWMMRKRVTVSILDAGSESAFLRSYHRLALDLDCPLQRITSATTKEEKLTLYQREIQQKLSSRARQDWLLVIDGMTTEMMEEYNSYLPQPGSHKWGRGFIVVTTKEDDVIQQYRHYNFAKHLEIEELSEEDAIALLKDVSECECPEKEEEHLKKIVNSNYVKRYPLEVVSAGIHIKASGCNFESYLKELPHSHTKASSFKAPGTGYRDTPISATIKAAKQLAKPESDDCLKKVFTVFAVAPHEPIPEDVIRRLSSFQGIAAIKNCGLISRNPEWEKQDRHATLHVHYLTREALREVFPPNNKIVQQFVYSLLQEFENTNSDPTWTKQLLFPHLKGFHDGKEFALDRSIRVQLGVALSNVYIDLNEKPHRAREVLSNLLKALEVEEKTSLGDLTPCERAKINSGLGKAYRHLGQYEESIKSLTQALEEKDHLNPTEVAAILKEFCSMIPSYSEYMESRELLKSVFKKAPDKYLSAQAEALSSLAYLYSKMGDWKDGKNYIREAENVLAKSSDPKHALTAKENLAVAYSELGEHRKCIKLLREVRDQIKKTNGDDHPTLAVPLARLSAAHYYNRERDESQKLAETVLKMKRSKTEGWNAVQILGTIACDFGDVARGNKQELINRIQDYQTDHTEWSVASKLLRGRVHRLLGDIKPAQETLESALEDSERVYGSNHIWVGRVLTQLGKVYQEQWYLTQALEAFQRSHSIHEKFYRGRGHPEVAFVKGDQAIILYHAGDKKNGLAMMEEALGICENNSDPESDIRPACMHVKYAQMLANYGIILRDVKRPRKFRAAREHLEKALQILGRDLSEKSIITIESEYALGTVHHGLANYVSGGSEQEDFEKTRAQKYMEKALSRIDSISLKHPYKATISTGLARLELGKKRYPQAEYHAKEALAILTDQTKSRDKVHPHVGYCYQILGDVAWLGESCDPFTAHGHYLGALQIYLDLIERETTHISDCKVNLGEITVLKTWNKRLERIKEKLLVVGKKMEEKHA